MRPRTRLAVSVLVVQIGSSTFRTMRRLDVGDGQVADDGIGVGLERRRPLLAVLRVLPSGTVRSDVALGSLLEGDLLRRLGLGLHPLAAPRLDRIDVIGELLPELARPLARFLQRKDGDGAEPHLARHAVPHVA